LSFHLQQLLRAGLITQRRASRQLIYAANFTTMNALVAYLTENCCAGGTERPCAAPVCRSDVMETGKRSKAKRKSA
jgi:hypothetical protein